MLEADRVLLEAFLVPVRKCAKYRPAFGQADDSGVTLEQFQALYGGDPFYAWIGLNDPAVYAAHKAAGGMTSVYRQIGVGTERLIRLALGQALALDPDQMLWSYEYDKGGGKAGTHTLDVKLVAAEIQATRRRRDFQEWLAGSMSVVGDGSFIRPVDGLAMEVRQGYKSADSKRQNADLRFGIRAYQAQLLPVVMVMSGQVSAVVIRRYRADGMLVLTGVRNDDVYVSTFAFFEHVIGYDLAAFFERNKSTLRREIASVVRQLLTPDA